jgi:hypothetical protein
VDPPRSPQLHINKDYSRISGASVVINGKPGTTAFVSATELRVTLDASDAAGDVNVVVINPDKHASPEFNHSALEGFSTATANTQPAHAVVGRRYLNRHNPETGFEDIALQAMNPDAG